MLHIEVLAHSPTIYFLYSHNMSGYSNSIKYYVEMQQTPLDNARCVACKLLVGFGVVVCKSLTYALTFCMQKGAAASASNALFNPTPYPTQSHPTRPSNECWVACQKFDECLSRAACQRQWALALKRMRGSVGFWAIELRRVRRVSDLLSACALILARRSVVLVVFLLFTLEGILTKPTRDPSSTSKATTHPASQILVDICKMCKVQLPVPVTVNLMLVSSGCSCW